MDTKSFREADGSSIGVMQEKKNKIPLVSYRNFMDHMMTPCGESWSSKLKIRYDFLKTKRDPPEPMQDFRLRDKPEGPTVSGDIRKRLSTRISLTVDSIELLKMSGSLGSSGRLSLIDEFLRWSLVEGSFSVAQCAGLASEDTVAHHKPKKGTSAKRPTPKVPKITKKDVLRYRLPFHEALCYELSAEGFIDTVAEIRTMVALDDAQVDTATDTLRPKLRNEKGILKKLARALGESEKWAYLGLYGQVCRSLVRTAIFFMTESRHWWWIAHRMITTVLQLMDSYGPTGVIRDKERLRAEAHYVHAVFLLAEGKDVDGAIAEASLARRLASHHSWTAEKLLEGSERTIYEEANRVLSRAWRRKSRCARMKQRLEFCKLAVDRAFETQDPKERADALLQLSKVQVDAGLLDAALLTLRKFYHICTASSHGPDMLCAAFREMALIHISMQNTAEAMKYLHRYQTTAIDNDLFQMAAEANCIIGEMHLRMENPEVAAFYLSEAFNLYTHLGLDRERGLARLLCGVAEAHQMLFHYVRLLVHCGRNQRCDTNVPLLRLLDWKDGLEPWWHDDTVFSPYRASQSLPEVAKSYYLARLEGFRRTVTDADKSVVEEGKGQEEQGESEDEEEVKEGAENVGGE